MFSSIASLTYLTLFALVHAQVATLNQVSPKNGPFNEIPLLGFGTWMLRDKNCIEAVAQAIEVGYRHFDGATAYQNVIKRIYNDFIENAGESGCGPTGSNKI
jgi:hypothetical protein